MGFVSLLLFAIVSYSMEGIAPARGRLQVMEVEVGEVTRVVRLVEEEHILLCPWIKGWILG